MKNDSRKFMKLACSFRATSGWSLVTKPMVAKTDTLMSAKPAPVAAKGSFVVQKAGTCGISRHASTTIPRASNMARL